MFTSLAGKVFSALARLKDEEAGQSLTEYALILTLIAVIALTTLALFGDSVTSVLSTVASSV